MTAQLPSQKPFTAEEVDRLEVAFLALPQVECSVVHAFAPGLYIRTVTMPTGAYVIGHHHKTAHLNNMLCGKLSLINGDGSHTELTAPQSFVSQPGRKIAFIHETVIWQNVFASDETDVDALEDQFLEKSEAFLNHAGYIEAIESHGFSHELALAISENEADLIPFPNGSYKVAVGASSVNGKGLMATAPIDVFEPIAPARLDGKRTPAGRYTNHSDDPNAMMVADDIGDIYLVAIKQIEGCKGGQVGEEITVDYRQALSVAKGEAE